MAVLLSAELKGAWNAAPNSKKSQQIIWAYLPVGPLERQLREEFQGVFGKRSERTFIKRLKSFFGGTSWGSLC
jgi:hypothetical protein